MGVLYEHWRPDLNECFYVGASWVQPEARPYEMDGRHPDHVCVQKALAEEGLSVEVRLIECGHLSDSELGELEVLQIAYWKDMIGDRLVNKAKGGEGFNIDWNEHLRDQHRKIRGDFLESPEGKIWSENHSSFLDGYWNGPQGRTNRETHSELKKSFYETDAGEACIEKIRASVSAITTTAESREATRKTKTEFYATEKGRKTCEQISNALIEFFQTSEGLQWRNEQSGRTTSSWTKPEFRWKMMLRDWNRRNVIPHPYWGA